MPPTSSPIISHSPVCSPARTSIPSGVFLRNRAGATNTARRAIESRKNAVPRCLDLMAAKASEIATDRGVMFVEEIMPAAIAKRGSFLGRANDVSKQNGGENPVHRDWRPRTG